MGRDGSEPAGDEGSGHRALFALQAATEGLPDDCTRVAAPVSCFAQKGARCRV